CFAQADGVWTGHDGRCGSPRKAAWIRQGRRRLGAGGLTFQRAPRSAAVAVAVPQRRFEARRQAVEAAVEIAPFRVGQAVAAVARLDARDLVELGAQLVRFAPSQAAAAD